MEKLSYETAKKLKDAGFERPSVPRDYQPFGEALTEEEYINVIKLIDLSELIEVCGDELALILRGAEGRWFAQGFSKDGGTNFLGSTPEEAVAALLISLIENGHVDFTSKAA